MAKVAVKYDTSFRKINEFTIDELSIRYQTAQSEHFSDGGVFDRSYTR